MNHPQAAASGGVGIIATLLVWAANRYGVEFGAVEGAAAASGMIAVGALIGRRGLRGIARILWRGSESQ